MDQQQLVEHLKKYHLGEERFDTGQIRLPLEGGDSTWTASSAGLEEKGCCETKS